MLESTSTITIGEMFLIDCLIIIRIQIIILYRFIISSPKLINYLLAAIHINIVIIAYQQVFTYMP